MPTSRVGDSTSVIGTGEMNRLRAPAPGVSASATCRLEFWIRLIDRSVRFRIACWTPTTFSTAFPASATTTSPTNASDHPSVAIAGCNAATNQSATTAAPRPAAASTPIASLKRPRVLDRRRDRGRALAALERVRDRRDEHDQQDDRDEHRDLDVVAAVRTAGRRGDRRDRQRPDGEHEDDRDRPHGRGVEHLAPVLEAAQQERQASTSRLLPRIEPISAVWVSTTRPVAQGEDRDEQLGQVAQRRLEHARRPGPEVAAQVVGALADEPGEPGERRRRDDEHDHVEAPPNRRPPVSTIPATERPIITSAVRPSTAAIPVGGWAGLVGHRPTLAAAAAPCQPAKRIQALDRPREAGAPQEQPLEDEEQRDREDARDRQRGDEDAEVGRRLQGRQADQSGCSSGSGCTSSGQR